MDDVRDTRGLIYPVANTVAKATAMNAPPDLDYSAGAVILGAFDSSGGWGWGQASPTVPRVWPFRSWTRQWVGFGPFGATPHAHPGTCDTLGRRAAIPNIPVEATVSSRPRIRRALPWCVVHLLLRGGCAARRAAVL
jgi:hypothetical protein